MISLKNLPFSYEDMDKYSEKISSLHSALEEARAVGSDFRGWLY